MGLATSTAISLAGLALATGSSAAGFAQLGKQNRLRKKAENAAEKALEEAKEKIDVNYARQLQVPLESYRRAMRESTAQQKQLLEAVQEGDQRGVAASVGKIGFLQLGYALNNRTFSDMMIVLQTINKNQRFDYINQLNVSKVKGSNGRLNMNFTYTNLGLVLD